MYHHKSSYSLWKWAFGSIAHLFRHGRIRLWSTVNDWSRSSSNMILDACPLLWTTSFKIWVVLCGQHVIWRPSTNGYVSSELGQRLGVGLGWVSIDHHWPIRGGHLGTQAFILVCWLLRALLRRACALQWHLRKKSSMVQMDQDARIFTELRR